jgi:hypothetical protein
MSGYDQSSSFLQQFATAGINNAEFYAQYLRGFAGDPGADRPSLREPSIRHTVRKPDIGPAPRLSDVLEADDGGAETIRLLDAETEKLIAKYFPAVDQCMKTLPEQALCDIVSGIKPFGLDKTVLEIAWHRARDRATRTMETERAQIVSLFSASGFTAPIGAQVAAESAAIRRASDTIAEFVREQAIQDENVRVEMFKMALQSSLDHKRGLLGVIGGFYQQWMAVPNEALERARLRAQAQATLTSALSTYYNVQVAFEELQLKVSQLAADTDIAVSRNRISNAQADSQAGKANAIASAVRSFSDAASQAAQAAGTLSAQVESI